jgi:hypothetical protein
MPPFLLLNEIVLVLSAGLLLAGFAVEMHPLLTQSRPKPAALAARGLLWAGTAGVWISAWINWGQTQSVIIERSLSESDFLGVWIAAVFTVVSGWRALSGRRAKALLALVWFAGLCVLGIYIKEIFLPTY